MQVSPQTGLRSSKLPLPQLHFGRRDRSSLCHSNLAISRSRRSPPDLRGFPKADCRGQRRSPGMSATDPPAPGGFSWTPCSFDDLVGEIENRGRDRQVAGLGALEDTVNITRSQPEMFEDAASVGE